MSKKWLLNRRRALWLGLAAFAGMGAVAKSRDINQSFQIQSLDNPEREFGVVGGASLKERAAAKGLIYGAATDYDKLALNSTFADTFLAECGMLVPEVALKWQALRPISTNFDFTKGDALLEFARAHNMLFRGHTLVWGDFLPAWFKDTVNSQNAEQVLLNHIKTVVSHYAGRIHSWDVVNEAVWPEDGRTDGLRLTPWLQLLGPDYIDLAFRAAAEADPQALLVYNDYGLDYDTPEDERRRVAVLRWLERLKSIGTPVHALGIQAHLQADETRFNPTKLRAFLSEVAGLGLKVLISELDVADNNLPKDVNVRDRIVAGIYEDYLSAVLDEPAVIAVVTWGLSDRSTWLSRHAPRKDNAPVRPLPLDAQLKRKLAWNAIARAFDKAPKRKV
jgi:endo-1,4-beta-xylanase